jgi:hypothetical protein
MKKSVAQGVLSTFVACLLLTLLFNSPALLAQDKLMAGGKITAAFSDQKIHNIGDAEGHTLTLMQSTGINAADKAGFMDGANVVNYSIGDLIKGTGHQFGYVMFAKGPDTTFAKWDHVTTTVLAAEGTPHVTFKGTFAYTKGTGQYMNIQGGGTYSGEFTTPTDYVVDWKGEYAITK